VAGRQGHESGGKAYKLEIVLEKGFKAIGIVTLN